MDCDTKVMLAVGLMSLVIIVPLVLKAGFELWRGR